MELSLKPLNRFSQLRNMSYRKIFLYDYFPLLRKSSHTDPSHAIEQAIVRALEEQIPVKDLPGASIDKVQEQPEQPFDVSFELRSGSTRIQVLGEIKTAFSPRQLEEIAPWIQRIKSLRPDVAIAVIAPALSTQAQAFCIQNGIDFIDLAGNISINVPGKFTLQRSGMKARGIISSSANGPWNINVFSGRSSRILRVLLEKPQSWSIT